jgi:hypothetical protein
MGLPVQPDPFTGRWTFNLVKSSANFSMPKWVEHIQSSSHELSIREEIISADGSPMTVKVRAAFDGDDYPVSGPLYAETMAYTRLDAHTILELANGIVRSCREIL